MTRRTAPVLILLLLLAFALRVTYFTQDRFHADEALYAGWALRILDGDPFLLEVPVDKPPLYLHTLAASMRAFGRSEFAARLPNLGASMLGIALVYRLGKRLYGRHTGLWAAFWICLSPFDILFARTAFTDPMLVLWVLAACNAAVAGRWAWAGVAMGLGFATKQHAVVLIPLPLLLGWAAHHRPTFRESGRRLLAATAGFAIPSSLVTWWDSARWEVRPGYWRQSALSYGGLTWADPAQWGVRFVEWGSWARYLVGSPLLYALLLVGTTALLLGNWGVSVRSNAALDSGGARGRRAAPRAEPRRSAPGRGLGASADPKKGLNDAVLAGCAAAYVVLHTTLQFSVWDRYLLPLAPLVALLLARIVERGMAWLARSKTSLTLRESCRKVGLGFWSRSFSWFLVQHKLFFLRALCVSMVVPVALFSGVKAALNGYPVGGEHWAYQGLDDAVAYLVEHAAPDAVLYHHWLRWHYTYYLHGTDFELRWWQSNEHLYREAARTPAREQYIILPDWGTLDPRSEGIVLEPVYETRRWDGSVSFRVYRIHYLPASHASTGPPRSSRCARAARA
jgi:4-amino-4-deoxy-L-arabinose transferase-like glycosyltransferase